MRLIDADAMNEKLFYRELGGKDVLITAESAFDMIKASPTAYDVEKVLKQLKEAETDISNLGTYAIPTDKAIKIALKGGINE